MIKKNGLIILKICIFLCAFNIIFPPYSNAQNKGAMTILVAENKDEKNQTLPISAFKSRIFSYLENALQMTFDIRQYPWKRVLYSAENGEGIVFGMYKNPSRMEKFNFSESIYLEYSWLVTKCDQQFPFNKIADLKGKTIGVASSASAGEEFDSQVGKLFKIEKNDTTPEGRFFKLYQGRMDAFLIYQPRTNIKAVQEELNARYASKIIGLEKTDKAIFCILPNPVSSVEVHFALSNQVDQTNLKKLVEVLIQAKKNGDLKKIMAY